jgi:hypothetical protein
MFPNYSTTGLPGFINFGSWAFNKTPGTFFGRPIGDAYVNLLAWKCRPGFRHFTTRRACSIRPCSRCLPKQIEPGGSMLARLSSGFFPMYLMFVSSCGWIVARFISMDIHLYVCYVLKILVNAEILVIAWHATSIYFPHFMALDKYSSHFSLHCWLKYHVCILFFSTQVITYSDLFSIVCTPLELNSR